MIISFCWTAPALVAGRKTATRRDWVDSHAARFHRGDLVQAWDRSPRYGGQRIGTIEIARDPYQEPTGQMPDDDFDAEGFAWVGEVCGTTAANRQQFDLWRADNELLWVVRFRLVEAFVAPEDVMTSTQLWHLEEARRRRQTAGAPW